MKKLTLGLSALALVAAGTAYAAPEASKRGADADSNGVVTRAEKQTHASAMFTRLDFNKDGRIDASDRDARREQRMTERFGALDTDKSGQISKSEFMARPARPEGAPDAKGDRRGGHGGKHRGWGGRGRGDGGMMGLGADTDKNGAISQAEFTAAALARFDRTDANKDGQVTKEERQAARANMREQMRAKWREGRSQAAPAKPAS